MSVTLEKSVVSTSDLDEIDLTRVGEYFRFNHGSNRAEIIAVEGPHAETKHVVLERFGSPESHGGRQHLYYFLGQQASGEDVLYVMRDDDLSLENNYAGSNDTARIAERHRVRAVRLTEGLSAELAYPEVTVATETESEQFVVALHGIAAAQRASSNAA